jgi:hypothetical protein
MIKHIVMWRVRGDTSDARRAASEQVKQLFEQLRSLIPGLLKLEVGIDVSGVDCACDVVLYTEFDSVSALEAYATHPEHLRVRNELGDLRVARFQVDYRPGEDFGHV